MRNAVLTLGTCVSMSRPPVQTGAMAYVNFHKNNIMGHMCYPSSYFMLLMTKDCDDLTDP